MRTKNFIKKKVIEVVNLDLGDSRGLSVLTGCLKSGWNCFSLSYPCPGDFNPADHYIYKLSMTPGYEDEYDSRVAKICDAYQESEYSETQKQHNCEEV